MITYAEAEFRLSMLEGKATLREHYQQAEKAGATVPELHPAPPPEDMLYLWGWFMDLFSSKAGPTAPISYSEIAAFSALRQITLDPWEVGAIRSMDAAYRMILSDHQAKQNG